MDQRKNKIILWGGLLLAVLAVGTFNYLNPVQPPPPKDPAVERQERIQKAFSAWNGAHRNLEQWVKGAMDDPDSYEHVETRYRDTGTDTLFIIMQFRGRNAFGGVVKNTVTCWSDIDGNLLSTPARIE